MRLKTRQRPAFEQPESTDSQAANAQANAGMNEAVLGPDGRIQPAVDPSRSKATLSRLKQSALAIARSGGTVHELDSDKAVDEWKGLIAARWTLLEVCETDGRKYLIACQNSSRPQGPHCLTEREQEVVEFAAMGHYNKLIAYTLGISHSTVRVLIARAARKLGARSRDELVRRCTSRAAQR